MVYIGLTPVTNGLCRTLVSLFPLSPKRGAFRRRTREDPLYPAALALYLPPSSRYCWQEQGGGKEGQGLPGGKMAEICFANCGAKSFSTIEAKAGHSS